MSVGCYIKLSRAAVIWAWVEKAEAGLYGYHGLPWITLNHLIGSVPA